MSARDNIIQRLRNNTHEAFPKPKLDFEKTAYADPVAAFIDTALTTAGAKVIEMKPDDDINELVRKAYPDAKTIASNVEGVKAALNPDLVENAQDLDGTDVGVIQGTVACAENACIWIPQTMKERAICFISEYLVIIIDKKNIVSNMHEAYERILMPESGFGTFMSGPSKTADIEQALVYGAQASRGLTIILK